MDIGKNIVRKLVKKFTKRIFSAYEDLNVIYYQILNWLLISTIWHVSLLQILSGLYIGNFRDSKDLKQLDLHKITHILSIHDDARKLFKVQIAKIFCP